MIALGLKLNAISIFTSYHQLKNIYIKTVQINYST